MQMHGLPHANFDILTICAGWGIFRGFKLLCVTSVNFPNA